MSDPYRISEPHREPPVPAAPVAWLRPALWFLLVISATCNMVTSGAGLPVIVGAGFGTVAVACIVALIVDHYRNRRS